MISYCVLSYRHFLVVAVGRWRGKLVRRLPFQERLSAYYCILVGSCTPSPCVILDSGKIEMVW